MNEEDIQNIAVAAEVQELLPDPDRYEYIILEAKPLPDNGLTTILRINLKSKEEVLKWITKYEDKNQITFRVLQTFKENTLKVVFKKEFRCIQNTLPKKGTVPRTLHTGCRAKLTTTLKNPNMKRSKDRLLKTHPCEIYIRHLHNHELTRPAGLELEHQFKVLFEDGYAPVAALAVIKEQLLLEHGKNYLEIIPEGKKRLCERWVNEFYLNLYKEPFAKPVDSVITAVLKASMNKYNKKCGDICAVINSQFLIAICSPLMKRNWEHINEITEVIYVHSSGNLDIHNTRVMLFLCPSSIGVLPLGILLLPCEDAESIIEGVRLLKTILPAKARVPKSIIAATTDEQKCEALKECFNIENVLMCRYYIQKSVMRFLWDGKNCVNRGERVNIYVTFIETLNCLTIKEFETTYDKLHRLTTDPSNNKLTKYFADLRACASLWAMCCRKKQKHDTNDYLEVMFKVIKNKILSNTLNIAKLFTYVASTVENYFFNRIKQIIECQPLIPEKKDKWFDRQGPRVFDCHEISNNLYTVSEKNKINIVNYAIDCCSCCVDKKGFPCKHKWALIQVLNSNLEENKCLVINDKLKRLLKKLLVDEKCILSGWFDNMEHLDALMFDENNEIDENEETNILKEDSRELIVDKLEEVHRKVIKEKLNVIVGIIMSKLKSDPEQFSEPVEKFIYKFGKCKTNNSLVAALENFGKPRVTVMPITIPEKPIEVEPNLPVTLIGLSEKKFVKIAPKPEIDSVDNKKKVKTFICKLGKCKTNNTLVAALDNVGQPRVTVIPTTIQEKPIDVEPNLPVTLIGLSEKKFVKIAPKPEIDSVDNKKKVKTFICELGKCKTNNTLMADLDNFGKPRVTVTTATIQETPIEVEPNLPATLICSSEKEFVKIAPKQDIDSVENKIQPSIFTIVQKFPVVSNNLALENMGIMLENLDQNTSEVPVKKRKMSDG